MPKRKDWNPNPTGKGLTPWAKKWSNTPTTAIRLPEVFSETITALARSMDRGHITPEQVEALIGETSAAMPEGKEEE